MTLPYWLAFKLCPWLERHVVAMEPEDAVESPRIVASQREQFINLDGEDALHVMYAAFPDCRVALERWAVWYSDHWHGTAYVAGVTIGHETFAAYSDAGAMEAVKGVLLMADARKTRAAAARGDADGSCC